MSHIAASRRAATIERLKENGWLAETRWFESLDSTNDYLKRCARGQPPIASPLLVVADAQTAGRGRGTNAWWSPSGCLTFSIFMQQPDRLGSRFNQLGLVVGLSLCEAIDTFLPRQRCKLKWPNDVYLNERKIAGILVESLPLPATTSDRTQAVLNGFIIGVGVNVQCDLRGAPQDILERATSLHLHAQGDLDPDQVLIEICDRLPGCLGIWIDDLEYLAREWPRRCCLTDRRVEIDTFGTKVHGVCLGISPEGELLVQAALGQTHRLIAGSVRLLD